MNDVVNKNLLVVLLAEDCRGDAELIRTYSKPFANINWVETLDAALRHLKTNDTDVIFLDLMLPDAFGAEAVKKIRENTCVPIIVLTGREDEDIYKECILAGADSVLNKDELNTKQLFRTIELSINRRKYLIQKMIDFAESVGIQRDVNDKTNIEYQKIFEYINGVSSTTELLIEKLVKINHNLEIDINEDITHGTTIK